MDTKILGLFLEKISFAAGNILFLVSFKFLFVMTVLYA